MTQVTMTIIENLSTSTSEKDLQGAFAPQSGVVEISMLGGGKAKISFKTKASAESAVKAFHNSLLFGKPVTLKITEDAPAAPAPVRPAVSQIKYRDVRYENQPPPTGSVIATGAPVLAETTAPTQSAVPKPAEGTPQSPAVESPRKRNGRDGRDGREPRPRAEKVDGGEKRDQGFVKIEIPNFPLQSTSDDLTALFQSFGEIDRVGFVKGVGFVTFKTHESAVKAIEGMNGHKYKDRNLTVEKRRERDAQPPYDERTICIEKAPRVSRDEIRKHFETCGQVRAVDFALNDKIYVTYTDPSETARALTELKTFKGQELMMTSVKRKSRAGQREGSEGPSHSQETPEQSPPAESPKENTKSPTLAPVVAPAQPAALAATPAAAPAAIASAPAHVQTIATAPAPVAATATPNSTTSAPATEVKKLAQAAEYPNNPVTQMYYAMEQNQVSKLQEENRALKEVNAHLKSHHEAVLRKVTFLETRLYYVEMFLYQMGYQAPQPQPYPVHMMGNGVQLQMGVHQQQYAVPPQHTQVSSPKGGNYQPHSQPSGSSQRPRPPQQQAPPS